MESGNGQLKSQVVENAKPGHFALICSSGVGPMGFAQQSASVEAVRDAHHAMQDKCNTNETVRSNFDTIDPWAEHAFWRSEYVKRPYVGAGALYEQYAPAFQYGWESCATIAPTGRTFADVEPELRRDWENHRADSKLSWENAKDATRDAWERLAKAVFGNC